MARTGLGNQQQQGTVCLTFQVGFLVFVNYFIHQIKWAASIYFVMFLVQWCLYLHKNEQKAFMSPLLEINLTVMVYSTEMNDTIILE